MDQRDKNAISDLFGKLRDVERQAGPRDAEAERLIAEEIGRLPGAPYYMAQTVVMQDMALNAKQRELDELKQRLEAGEAHRDQPAENGGFLSRMFGGGAVPQPSEPPRTAGQGGPWGSAYRQPQTQPSAYAPAPAQYAPPQQSYPSQTGGSGRGMGGGGFLAGAAQTAMGVAGGVVLGNAIGSMFGGHHGGLFGGETPTEVVNETTNIYEEAPSDNAQPAFDGGGTAAGDDDPNDGYQDASFDDAGDFSDDGSDQI